MSTYGLDAKKILKLDKGAPNTLTIFPGGSGDEDKIALDDKDILQLNAAEDVLTIFPGGADDTIALDDKKILGLTSGGTILTLFPDGVTDDKVAIGPEPPDGTVAGDIIYRASDGTGTFAKVDVQPPVTFSSTGVLSYEVGHVGGTSSRVGAQVRTRNPTIVPQNMTLATVPRVGLNFITRNRADRTCYLPGGDWTDPTTTNCLPETCNSFQFLEVQANMDIPRIEGTNPHIVYVPCYYNIR